MGFFSDLFGGGKANPYKQAAPYYEQIPGQLHQYYDPYIEMGGTGREQMGDLYQQYGAMAQDPGAYQAQLGAGFQEDPGYKWNLDQQLQAQNQAMAAGGMSGSPQSQQFAQELAGHLADQQYQQYMQNQMGIAGTGLQGQTGIAGTNLQFGFGASDQMAQNMQDYLYNRGNLAAGRAQDYRNRLQGGIGAGLGLGSSLLGGLGRSTGGASGLGSYPTEMTSMAAFL